MDSEVSILVVVESALRGGLNNDDNIYKRVSILVVVESALRVMLIAATR